MKYLLKNGKVLCSGSKKQLIEYVKTNYADEYWVREYGKLFDSDFGKFKFAIETIGLQLSDKMPDKEYTKNHRKWKEVIMESKLGDDPGLYLSAYDLQLLTSLSVVD
mgnify:CR=1 FL=1